MVSYSNSTVVQYLRQYEMFANSLRLIKKADERDMIVKQLTKLENKIIDTTNESYEEEYYILANKECGLLDEEKSIYLVKKSLEENPSNHYQYLQTLEFPFQDYDYFNSLYTKYDNFLNQQLTRIKK